MLLTEAGQSNANKILFYSRFLLFLYLNINTIPTAEIRARLAVASGSVCRHSTARRQKADFEAMQLFKFWMPF